MINVDVTEIKGYSNVRLHDSQSLSWILKNPLCIKLGTFFLTISEKKEKGLVNGGYLRVLVETLHNFKGGNLGTVYRKLEVRWNAYGQFK